MRSVNVHGTKNIVEAALSQGCRLIHLSTALVVGATKQKIISEDTECHPRDSYEQGKLEGENLVREGIAKGLKAQILRPSYVFGAGRAPEDDPFYQLVVSIKKGRYRNVKGGKGLYNIVHVDEVVRAMLLLDNDCVPNGGTYFINTPISFKRLSTIVKTVITDRTCEVPSIPYAVLFSATILLSALAVVTGKSMPLTFSRLKSLTNEKVYSQKRLKDTEVYRPLHNIEEYVVQTCKNYMQNGMI